MAKTPQEGTHIEVFEPKQTAVCRVNKVVIAYMLVGVLAFSQVQNQLPFGGKRLGFRNRKDLFSKSLDFFQRLLVVKVCVGEDRLR